MKKSIFKAVHLLALTTVITATLSSCGRNATEDVVAPTGPTVNAAKFEGHITTGQTVTLDATQTYHLTGSLIVDNGATLVIPAGTHIVGEKGATYLLVDRGGKIFINGTAAKPVLFDGATHGQGNWGGIVLLGNAPSNRSAAGTSTSELGDLTYGGTNSLDSSGIINYCIILDTGFKYNPEKEFNGLSLFGCGSGTSVSYVYVADSADDPFESFGGSPKYDHLVMIGNQDDSFDWTEGFTGSASYIYAARNKKYQNGTDPGNRGIEADTQDTDPNTTNGNGVSNPDISNATFIGNPAGSESQGMKLRAGSNGKFNNIIIANYSTGLDFETDRTYDWFKGGSYLSNIKFVNVAKAWKSKASTKYPTGPDMSTTFTVNNSATGAGNGTALPDWAKGWTGLTTWDVANSTN